MLTLERRNLVVQHVIRCRIRQPAGHVTDPYMNRDPNRNLEELAIGVSVRVDVGNVDLKCYRNLK